MCSLLQGFSFAFIDIDWVQKNLDFLVFLIKNWPNDLTTRFDKKIGIVDLGGFGQVEEGILDVIVFESLRFM